MKLRIRTNFRADYVRPKKRSSESVLIEGWSDVEVREVAEEDAPIVHVVSDRRVAPDPRTDYSPFAPAEGGACRVRFLDGEYWAERVPSGKFEAAALKGGAASPFNGLYCSSDGRPVVGGILNEDKVTFASRADFEKSAGMEMRKWEDRSDETRAAFARRAEAFISVGGTVYERVGEPALTLVIQDDEITLRITEATPAQDGYSRGRSAYHPGNCIRFGVDEIARAVSEGERLAAERGIPFRSYSEVLACSPWQVRFRGEPELMAYRAKTMMSELASHVGGFDPLFGKAWHDLSVAVSRIDRATPASVDAVRRICAMDDRFEGEWTSSGQGSYGSHGRSSPETLRILLRGLQEALHMWDTRDPQGIEWADAGLGATATFDGEARAYEITDLMEADRVSRLLGSELSGMAEDASRGAGFLIAVDEDEIVRSAFFVTDGEDGPAIAAAVTSHGGEPSKRHSALALRHFALAREAAPALEADLDALGL